MTTDQPHGTDEIDTGRPHPARVYDWFLGGKDNYPVDEALGRQILAIDPTVTHSVQVNRRFMHRVIRWAAENGIRQFLDIGTGIPTEPNLHQVAQEFTPEARVVYVDNDPIVLRHAEALLRSSPEGVTDYIQADVREPEKIIERAGRVLDLDRPVAMSLIALLHFIPDEEDPYGLVRELMDGLAPGSHLILSHVTADFDPEAAEEVTELYDKGGVTLRCRDRGEVSRFFDGLTFVEPGLSLAPEWRPELGPGRPDPGDPQVPGYVGVARKD